MTIATEDVRPPPGPSRPSPKRVVVRIVGVAGRVFVGGGLLLLFFTGYLLWGTGVYTKQEQRRATQTLARNPIVTEERLAGGEIPPARPTAPPRVGDPLFTVKVPRIGLETVVVFGVGRDELRKGPGLFPDCRDSSSGECVDGSRFPGESGNVPVSGHRTTYGAPFYKINELEKGDVIDFVSGRVRYRYRVREQQVVDPVAGFAVVEQHGRDEVTLTTCHPRFSAAQRLIVRGDYEGASLVAGAPPARTGPRSEPARTPQPYIPADVLILAIVAVASALGALGLSKRFRMTAAYVSIAGAGAAGLWVGVFPRVLALMPANY